MRGLAVVLSLASAASYVVPAWSADEVDVPDLQKAMQTAVDAVSSFHNTSFSVSLRSESTGLLTAFSGLDDRSNGRQSRLTEHSRFPMGSVTKSWTAAGIMRYSELGLIDIDEPISLYTDDLMTRLNGTTLAALWHHDPRVINITARGLMSMRAGLNDYDDAFYADWTWSHPDQDWSPFDILHRLNKTFVCGGPNTCGHYASPGYDILGLALCQLSNCSSWETLDFKAVLPADLLDKFEGATFPEKGKCLDDPKIVHQYNFSSVLRPGSTDEVDVSYSDIIGFSCLNGWACGSIAATTSSVADWYWDLLGTYSILEEKTITKMLNGTPLTNGWSPGLKYGLGLSHYGLGARIDPENATNLIGHGGADWGSVAHFSGLNVKHNFSICFAANSVSGLNCSKEYQDVYALPPGEQYAEKFYYTGVCEIYDAILQIMSHGTAMHLKCAEGKKNKAIVAPSSEPHPKPPTNNYSYTCHWDF